MTPNQLVVRNLVGVVIATAVITTAGLWLGTHGPSPTYQPIVSNDPPGRPSPARGEALFAKLGCSACHTTDGSARVGPSLAKRWGTTVGLSDESRVTFDEAYVRESVLAPQARAQAGYPPSMPTFDGIVKDSQLADLAAYLRAL